MACPTDPVRKEQRSSGLRPEPSFTPQAEAGLLRRAASKASGAASCKPREICISQLPLPLSVSRPSGIRGPRKREMLAQKQRLNLHVFGDASRSSGSGCRMASCHRLDPAPRGPGLPQSRACASPEHLSRVARCHFRAGQRLSSLGVARDLQTRGLLSPPRILRGVLGPAHRMFVRCPWVTYCFS